MNSDREYYNWRISHGLNVAHLKPPTSAPEPAEPSTPRALSAQDKWDINHSIEESHLDIEFMDAEQLRSEIRRLRTALAARSEAPAAPKEGK